MDPTKVTKFGRRTIVLVTLILLCVVASLLYAYAPIDAAAAVSSNSAAPLTPVGSGFTYQGSLKNGGSPANGQYDFQFTLYDALTGGNLVGGPITTTNVTITGGLFSVTLDFGQPTFTGDARYLEIAVRQTGGGTYTTLTPRQPLTPAPYALSLKPGAVISGTAGGAMLIAVNNDTNGYGIGVRGDSPNGFGVYGNTSGAGGAGVYGNSTGGTGVYGISTGGIGVYGASNSGTGMYADSTNGYGVYGISSYSVGVRGDSVTNEGVHGETNSNYAGVYGYNGSSGGIGPGVRGDGNTGPGVYGLSSNNKGVWGVSTTQDGVYGTSDSFSGVAGISNSGNGVYGRSTSGYAGRFDGNVRITGSCCAAGEGTYRIDHPLDPANKYLDQSAVVSPNMLDILDGNITTDAGGSATVQLPSYFEALNTDFRYQLTAVGRFAQAIVSSKVKNNTFMIKTDKPNVEVSWQVTGVRHDPYATAHPVQPEQDKPSSEKGKYLYPKELGQPETLGINYEQSQGAKQLPPEPPVPTVPTLPTLPIILTLGR